MRNLFRRRNKHESLGGHGAQFDAVSHFCVTVQLSTATNIARATRQLLAAGIAESAAWPNDDKIRVSKRMYRIGRSITAFRKLHDDYALIKNDHRLRARVWFAYRHPRLGFTIFQDFRARRAAADLKVLAEKSSLKSILTFTVRHPIVAIVKVFPRIRISRNGSEQNAPAESAELDIELGSDPAASEDSLDDPLQVVESAERSSTENQRVSLIERQIDHSLFGGREHDENRFVRMLLRDSYHDIKLPGSDQVQSVVFEPRLLLHQSGALQLNIRVQSETPLDVSQLLEFTSSQYNMVLESRYSVPWLKGSPWEAEAELLDGAEGEDRLGILTYTEPVPLREVFFDHLAAIERVINRQYNHWTIYPIAMLKPGDCCADDRFDSRHEQELAQIAFRAPRSVAQHVPRPKDLSMDPDESLYASLGNATHIQWRGPSVSPVDELFTTMVLEYALLTQMRLVTMERSLTRPATSGKLLRARYDEAIRLFSELRHGSLRSGEARDIARHLLSEFGVDDMRRTIEVALDLDASSHAISSSDRAARRSWRLTLLGTLVAIFVAVPPRGSLLDSVAELPTASVAPWLRGPVGLLQEAASLGFWGPWAVLGALVATVLAISALRGIAGFGRVRMPPLSIGYPWPRVVSFAESDPTLQSSPERRSPGAR